jgi:type IV pilus assembly protein PilA
MSPRTSRQANRSRTCHGFSLIELLIVVAIILVIAAIAIPNFLRSKMAANEASAAESLRTINTGCVTYSTTYGIGFPSTLANLGGPLSGSTSADMIDSVLAAGLKSGYSFTYVAVAAGGGVIPAYTLTANPVTPGVTGNRYFFTDQSNVIRFNVSAVATVSDAPIQ